MWRLCCHLWKYGLSLWQPAVLPVDAGSSHWPLSSVFILYEYTSHQIVTGADIIMSFMCCFTIINDSLIDWSSLFRLMLLQNMYTRDGIVGETTMLSLVAPRVVFVTACGATGRCKVVTLTAPPSSNVYILRIYMLGFRRENTYWYCKSLALRPNGQHF